MSKKLWQVSWDAESRFETRRVSRYSLGDTKEEAIEHVQPFLSKTAINRNFEAAIVDVGDGEIFLWDVYYDIMKSDCSGMEYHGPCVMIGRTREEAIMRTQATLDSTACNFEVYKVEDIQGFRIRILEVQSPSELLNAASKMSGE